MLFCDAFVELTFWVDIGSYYWANMICSCATFAELTSNMICSCATFAELTSWVNVGAYFWASNMY